MWKNAPRRLLIPDLQILMVDQILGDQILRVNGNNIRLAGLAWLQLGRTCTVIYLFFPRRFTRFALFTLASAVDGAMLTSRFTSISMARAVDGPTLNSRFVRTGDFSPTTEPLAVTRGLLLFTMSSCLGNRQEGFGDTVSTQLTLSVARGNGHGELHRIQKATRRILLPLGRSRLRGRTLGAQRTGVRFPHSRVDG